MVVRVLVSQRRNEECRKEFAHTFIGNGHPEAASESRPPGSECGIGTAGCVGNGRIDSHACEIQRIGEVSHRQAEFSRCAKRRALLRTLDEFFIFAIVRLFQLLL